MMGRAEVHLRLGKKFKQAWRRGPKNYGQWVVAAAAGENWIDVFLDLFDSHPRRGNARTQALARLRLSIPARLKNSFNAIVTYWVLVDSLASAPKPAPLVAQAIGTIDLRLSNIDRHVLRLVNYFKA